MLKGLMLKSLLPRQRMGAHHRRAFRLEAGVTTRRVWRTRSTVRNLGPSRLAGRSAMMADENGAAARSFHLFLPLFRRLGSALSLARPPWRERRTYVADSQHHWAIPVEQAQRAHTPHA